MTTKICEECSLPLAICNALAAYRKAVEKFERGDTAAAREWIEFAEAEFQRYRTEGKTNV